jgi:hypothetical protein
MHLATKKLPLLVPLLEPVCPRDVFPRTWNLRPCWLVLQYSTPNGIQPVVRETLPDVLRPEEEKESVPNALHAGEHDVRHCGTRRNRTSAAASGDGARRVRSNRGGNREFFLKKPLPDGPRKPPTALGPLAAAGEPVPGSDAIAGDGVPCPSRSPDTAARPATATISLPPCYMPCYSSVPRNEGG